MKNLSSPEPVYISELSELLFPMLRAEICSARGAEPDPDEEKIKDVLRFAKRHDISHLAADYLLRRDIAGSMTGACKEIKAMAQYRTVSQKSALSAVCSLFQAEQIDYIPLKGAVLKTLYPSEWMRTCADIDILIHQEDLQKAEELICLRMKVIKKVRGSHDVKLIVHGDVAIELHYKLIEDRRVNNVSKLLSDVWRYAVGAGCEKALTNEMFYFYHIAHMAKHFENGGCGIRSFIDLWLLRHRFKYDKAEVAEMLKTCELDVFEQKAASLSEKWFSGGPVGDPDNIERYILTGGMFGSFDRTVSNRKASCGGSAQYLIRRLFVSYDDLKLLYPKLEKRRYLTPAYEVIRWFRFKDPDSRKHTVSELKHLKNSKTDASEEVLHEMGLV